MDIKAIKENDDLNLHKDSLIKYLEYLNNGDEKLPYNEFKTIVFYLNNKINDDLLTKILHVYEKESNECKLKKYITKKVQDNLLETIKNV